MAKTTKNDKNLLKISSGLFGKLENAGKKELDFNEQERLEALVKRAGYVLMQIPFVGKDRKAADEVGSVLSGAEKVEYQGKTLKIIVTPEEAEQISAILTRINEEGDKERIINPENVEEGSKLLEALKEFSDNGNRVTYLKDSRLRDAVSRYNEAQESLDRMSLTEKQRKEKEEEMFESFKREFGVEVASSEELVNAYRDLEQEASYVTKSGEKKTYKSLASKLKAWVVALGTTTTAALLALILALSLKGQPANQPVDIDFFINNEPGFSEFLDLNEINRNDPQAVINAFDAFKDAQVNSANQDKVAAEEERDQAIVDKNQAEEEKGQAIVDKNQAVADRDQAAEERDQAVADRDQAVADRDQAIEDKEAAETERDAIKIILNSVQTELEGLKAEKAAIEAQIKDLYKQLEESGMKNEELLAQITALINEHADCENTISELEITIAGLEQKIENMESSTPTTPETTTPEQPEQGSSNAPENDNNASGVTSDTTVKEEDATTGNTRPGVNVDDEELESGN